MEAHSADKTLDASFDLLHQSPLTVAVLRKLRSRHGVEAALDAILLILIKRADNQTCVFTYSEPLQQFCTNYPQAISMLDHAMSAYRRENAAHRLRLM